MDDMVTIMVRISTNKVGSTCMDTFEIEREVWESMSYEEREDMCRDAAFNYLDWGWEEL